MTSVTQYADWEAGSDVPGSPRWHYIWIMQLEGKELYEYVMEIGVEKTIEAFDGNST